MNPSTSEKHSFELHYSLDADRVQSFEEMLGREGYSIEPGDKLAPCRHWLIRPESEELKKIFSNLKAPGTLYWSSGSISFENPVYLGDSCKESVSLNISSEDGRKDGTQVIQVERLITCRGKPAIRESQTILRSENAADLEKPRKIEFSPDWEQKVESDQLKTFRQLRGSMAGADVFDFLSQENISNDALTVYGSPALLLLLESFDYHFSSRIVDRVHYQAHSFSPDTEISIAGEDSDAFVTSLRIVNSRRKVLFGADIRWSYNW